MTTDPKLYRDNRRDGLLFLMTVMFVGAAIMPTPSLNELDHAYGEVISVNPSENNRDTQIQLAGNEIDAVFLVHGLSLAETEEVRSLSRGTNIELWYWDPPFGFELDVWQIQKGVEVIVPFENRLHEFQLTQRLFLAVGAILGAVAFFPYLRSKVGRKSIISNGT